MSYFNRYLLGGFVPTPAAVGGEFTNVLYTGTGANQSIDGLGYRPDLVWLKGRSDAEGSRWFDTTRGANQAIFSNSNDPEVNVTGELTSFDSNGFTLGSNENVNQNTQTYVAWCWKAGSDNTTAISPGEFWVDGVNYASAAAAGLTGGTITPTGCSINTTTKFSIITYNGGGNDYPTIDSVPHGLGIVPSMFIIKSRDVNTTNWVVWHKDLANATASPAQNILLNSDNPELTTAQSLGDGGPTAALVEVSQAIGGSRTNDSGQMVMYCWGDATGANHFGTYTGNGNVAGPTITTGMKPDMVMIKSISGGTTNPAGTSNWIIKDNKRGKLSPNEPRLYANTSDIETNGANIDFQTNGFQITSASNQVNDSTGGYIYAAWKQGTGTAFNPQDYYYQSSLDLSGVAAISSARTVKLANSGTKAYILSFRTSGANRGSIYEFDLATAYDISTATYSGNSIVDANQRWTGFDISPDGTKIIAQRTLGGVASNSVTVAYYTLSTAYDLSTATLSFTTGTIWNSYASGETAYFDSGNQVVMTRVFSSTAVAQNDIVYATLTTPYDLSTIGATTAFTITGTDMTAGGNTGISFNSAGTIMTIYNTTNDKLYRFNLTTANDITTLTYANSSAGFGPDGDTVSVNISDDDYAYGANNVSTAYGYRLVP